MGKPTIIFVPGFWEGVAPFSTISTALSDHGYSTVTASLPSTGKSSPNNPSMHDDVAAIRAVITPFVENSKDVLLVLHSAGGFLGSNAIEGLSVQERKAEGLAGGVCKIVFLAGAVFEEGFRHSPLPFFDFQGDRMYCKSPQTLLFNDIPAPDAAHWLDILQSQPATGWDDTVTYTGWKKVPSIYLLCEGDQAVPPPFQEHMAKTAGAEVVRCGAGHMVMLGMPDKVLEVVRAAAGEVV